MKKGIVPLVSIIFVVGILIAGFGIYNKYYHKDVNKEQNINSTGTKNVPESSDTDKISSQSETDKDNTSNKVNKVIVIDPGHANRSNLDKEPLKPNSSEMKIKDGGGAEGVVTKNPEYMINMQVSLKLKQILEQRGYTVKLTKSNNSESLGNVERAAIWNKDNADLVIRIHADSNDSKSVKGASMLVPAPVNENTKAIFQQSEKYGQVVLNALTNEVGMQNRGVVERDDMTGFNWSKVPVILVEMGFLSNPDEDRLLGTEDYQNKISKALADGIIEALK